MAPGWLFSSLEYFSGMKYYTQLYGDYNKPL